MRDNLKGQIYVRGFHFETIYIIGSILKVFAQGVSFCMEAAIGFGSKAWLASGNGDTGVDVEDPTIGTDDTRWRGEVSLVPLARHATWRGSRYQQWWYWRGGSSHLSHWRYWRGTFQPCSVCSVTQARVAVFLMSCSDRLGLQVAAVAENGGVGLWPLLPYVFSYKKMLHEHKFFYTSPPPSCCWAFPFSLSVCIVLPWSFLCAISPP